MDHPAQTSAEAQSWVDATFNRLTPRQRWAQLLHPSLPGGDPVQTAVAWAKLGLGGWFQGGGLDAATLRASVAAAIAEAPVAPLISSDYECGALIEDAPSYGTTMSLAAVADLDEATALAEAVGRAAAEQGRAVGTRWTFAPVVDLNLDCDNPIVNTRSYGDDPARVTALAAAFIAGAQGAGMACTAKHFPGDGLDRRDQHLLTSQNPLSLAQWRLTFAPVYRAMIEHGVQAVMLGHIALAGASSRHPTSGLRLPATADAQIVELLRGELGFRGVIVSDAIGMLGLKGHFPYEAERIVATLSAGCDVVLFPNDPLAALDIMEAALATGRLHRARLEASVRRVLALKAALGLHRSDWLPAADTARALLDPARSLAACTAIAQRSITVLRDRAAILPLQLAPGATVVVFDLPPEPLTARGGLVVAGQEAVHASKGALLAALTRRGLHPVVVCDHAGWQVHAPGAAVALFLCNTRAQAGRGSVRLSYDAVQHLELCFEPAGPPTVLVSLGNPYVAWEMPWMPTVVGAFAAHDAVQEALVEVLLGERPAVGRCPVNMPSE